MAIKKFTKRSSQAGVTLIELILVIAIIAIVSSVVVFNFGDFTSNISLRNLAQEMALTVRKAQTYATSVKGIDGRPPEFPAYGISFSTAEQGGGSTPGTKNFVLFADKNGNGKYDRATGDVCTTALSTSECIESFSIATEDSIKALCADIPTQGAPDTNGNAQYRCGVAATNIDAIFVRPNPDARIYSDGNTTTKSFGTIILHSPIGKERIVTIYSTGQISTR